MKVNILGKGRVPGINRTAPIKNFEANLTVVSHIIKIRSFRVFTADSNIEITKSNIGDIFSGRIKFASTPVEKPVEEPVEEKAPAVEEVKEEIVADVTEEEVEQSFVEDVTTVEEQLPEEEELEVPITETDVESFDTPTEVETIGEEGIEEVEESEESVEETEEKPKKKNKKKRN